MTKPISKLILMAFVALGLSTACTENRTEGDARPTTPMEDSSKTGATGTTTGPAATTSEGSLGDQTGTAHGDQGSAKETTSGSSSGSGASPQGSPASDDR